MKKIHAKSECCGDKIYRYGKRRRQCSACKKTWKIRPKKRGRRQKRVHPNLANTALMRGESLRKNASRKGVSRETIRRRHWRNLEALLKTLHPPKAPEGRLIAVVDGWAVNIGDHRYTVYLILLRPVEEKEAVVMEPYIARGHERLAHWKIAFEKLSAAVNGRIVALVSDGLTGMHVLARENHWIYQRCHFHIIQTLQKLRGRRFSTVKKKEEREHCYQLIRTILECEDESIFEAALQKIKALITEPDFPKWVGLRTRGVLRQIEHVRAYREYSDLNIPHTTNSAECICGKLTRMLRRTRGFNTVDSLSLWVTIKVRSIGKIACNGKTFPHN